MHKLSLQRWKGAEKELQLLQHVWHIELQCVYSPNSPWSDQWVQFICGFWQTQNVKSSLLPKGHPHSPLLRGSRGDERRGVVPAASAAVSLGSCCLSFTALLFCIWDNLGVNMDLVGERSRAFNLSGWKCERRARLTSIFFKRALFIKKTKTKLISVQLLSSQTLLLLQRCFCLLPAPASTSSPHNKTTVSMVMYLTPLPASQTHSQTNTITKQTKSHCVTWQFVCFLPLCV